MHSHNHRVSKIRKLISGRKVLLVLDDANNFKQLQALGIHPASFVAGSRITVTTRDKWALGILPHASHKIRFFNRRESLELFTQLTYEKDDIVDKKLVKEIVCCAGGLPLVLEKLQISYDSLNKRAQKLFLDIACFFDGMYKDLVVKLLLNKETAFFLAIQIRDLVDKGLFKRRALSLMHHVIRDMGKKIVRQESKDEPGRRSRLRDHRDVLHGTDLVESIRLDFEKKEVITVQTWSTNDMPSFALKQFKYLEWYGFPLECININMHNVEVVRLENCKLEILWEGFKVLSGKTASWNLVPFNPANVFKSKLQQVKATLKQWWKNVVEKENLVSMDLHNKINELDIKAETSYVSTVEVESRTTLVKSLADIKYGKVKDLKQKAKTRWALEGDENTSFFHGIINNIRNRSCINGLNVQGEWVSDEMSIKNHVFHFFSIRYKEVSCSRPVFKRNLFKRLSFDDVHLLESPFSLVEIKDAI
nr:hypothetical protein [Tanacetum cinerariifolium]